jgi:peptidoglycan hydrolase-like protein with peptidoglycan-binding domain
MKALRIVLWGALTIVLLAGTAFGAGVAVRHFAGGDATMGQNPGTSVADSPSDTTSDDASDDPATDPSAEPSDQPTSEPKPPGPVLEPGDKGERVRELQYRLYELAWMGELTTGKYDGQTTEAVRGFQEKRGFKGTGVVDERTWKRLVAMTKTPTHDQKFNILHPGPTLIGPGASGDRVRDLQARLIQIQWLFGDVVGNYDAATVAAVKGFQKKREIPVTGDVDQRTLDRLVAMTHTPTHEEKFNIDPEPGALDPRCRTGRALCVDKSTNSLRWVIDGQVQMTVDVRFGSDELPTREGQFSVFQMEREHVSSLYHTSMPFAMFFSGGQAVHYSPDFAANGYNGASHGCVNVRDYDAVASLFDQVQIGDKVIVYWS